MQMALLEARLGHEEEAIASLTQTRQLWVELPPGPELLARFIECEVEVMVSLGLIDRAEQLMAELATVPAEGGERRPVLRGSIALAKGRPEEALRCVEGLEAPHLALKVELSLLRARASMARSDLPAAVAELEPTLREGLSAGYGMTFAWHTDLAPVFSVVGRTSPIPALTAMMAMMRQSPFGVALPDTPEVLSEREMQVLVLLPTHLSNPEIASRLYVSTNTVKTHIRNIYRKLFVGSRSEAVERARTLGLID